MDVRWRAAATAAPANKKKGNDGDEPELLLGLEASSMVRAWMHAWEGLLLVFCRDRSPLVTCLLPD